MCFDFLTWRRRESGREVWVVDLLPPGRHQEAHLRPLQPRLLLLRGRLCLRLLEEILDEELRRGVGRLVDDALDEEVTIGVHLHGHFRTNLDL